MTKKKIDASGAFRKEVKRLTTPKRTRAPNPFAAFEKEGRRLNRAMADYAAQVAKDSGVTYAEALKAMRDNPAQVARDLNVSPAFVFMWTGGNNGK